MTIPTQAFPNKQVPASYTYFLQVYSTPLIPFPIYIYIYRSLHTAYYTWYVLVILGHFTQVVWKSSQRLGIAKAKSSSGWTYVCASYDPPGNYAGQFTANVPPPLSFQMVKGSPIAISNASKLEFP